MSRALCAFFCSATLNTADAYDRLASVVAGQLGSGAVFTNRVNRAPQITSVPVTYAAASSAYAHAAQAQDLDGDPLRWRLGMEDGSPLPSGLGIDAAGLLRWTSALPDSYTLLLRVDDGQAVAEQGFTLTAGTEADPLGGTTRTQYPAFGRPDQRLNPLSVTDPRGHVTSYSYPAGQEQQPGAVPSLIAEPLGRSTAIGLDAKGNLQSLNVAGNATSYGYDAQGRKTTETDALGTTTRYTYDAAGHELTRSLNRTVGGQTRTETSTRSYDAEGRLTSETDATGAARRSTYNKAGKVETSTDALGRITRYGYDANARLIRTEHPDGSAETWAYDANGNEVARTDRQGRTTRMEFDALNRHTRTLHPDGSAEVVEYDAAGRQVASVNAAGARSTYEYDAAGQQTASVDASGRRTEHSYDANGNRVQTKMPDVGGWGRLVKFTYDALNRLTLTEYPDGSTHSIGYRPDGRKATETDARGTTSTYGYDAKGQLVSVVQSGVGTATTYAYDEQGAKTTQTDALGRQVKWSHDAAGRPLARTLPDGATETFQYDLEGQLTARTTFGGQRIQSTFDAAGRELTRIVPATANTPARTVSWTYDAEGRRLTQTESGETSAQGTTRYRYDARGRLVEQASPQGTLAWAYDNEGRVTERSTSEGTSRYQYDGGGRLVQLTAPDGRTVVYSHDAAGRNTRTVQQLNPGIELVTDKRFDAQDRQTSIAHSRQAGTLKTLIAGQRIQRGQGGAVSRLDTFDETASFDEQTSDFAGTPSRIQVFGYDANARLTSEKEYKQADIAAFLVNPSTQATKATSYGYDDVGNRVAKTVVAAVGTESTAYAYDSNDRLTTETLSTAASSTVTTTYTWDGNGNMASKVSPSEYTGYVFDADNRLIEVRRGASPANAQTVGRYGYDAEGQRVRKTTQADGSTTHFLIDPTTTWPQVVLETTSSGQNTQSTAYVWGTELRQQTRGGQGTLFGSPDEDLLPMPGHLGTTIAAGSRAGAAVERYEAGAFGEGLSEAARLRHQFAGEYWDEVLGLQQTRARWYGTSQGQFLSRDTADPDQEQPKAGSLYAYAQQDPLINSDPSGETTVGETGVAQTAQGFVNTAAQTTVRHQIRSFLIGSPRKGDFGLAGELVFAHMGEALDHALRSMPKGSGPARIGDAAHWRLKEIVARLNGWLEKLPIAREVRVEAELFLFPDKSPARPNTRPRGTVGLDVIVWYRNKKWVMFDMKTGVGDMRPGKRIEYQRRFGARVISVGVVLLP